MKLLSRCLTLVMCHSRGIVVVHGLPGFVVNWMVTSPSCGVVRSSESVPTASTDLMSTDPFSVSVVIVLRLTSGYQRRALLAMFHRILTLKNHADKVTAVFGFVE